MVLLLDQDRPAKARRAMRGGCRVAMRLMLAYRPGGAPPLSEEILPLAGVSPRNVEPGRLPRVAVELPGRRWARQRLAVLDEAAVSIGTTPHIGRTAEELAELVVPRFADFASVDLIDAVLQGPAGHRPAGRDGRAAPGDPRLRELASRAAVCVDNARRYTRERITALTLQRSLLPRGPAQLSAAEVACRYRPTDSLGRHGREPGSTSSRCRGRGWPCVVGDVVGHGVHASATMGRLRTAVQHAGRRRPHRRTNCWRAWTTWCCGCRQRRPGRRARRHRRR